MNSLPPFVFLRRRPLKIIIALTMSIVLLLVAFCIHFDIKGHFDGLFILKGRDGWSYEIKDDLYVGDSERVIYGIDFGDPRYRIARLMGRSKPAIPYIYTEWDQEDGSGFIRSFFPGGKELFTSFGRFMADDGQYVHGLFVGGGLPASILGNANDYMNSTGMSWFDCGRWYHIWCNVNEGFIARASRTYVPPSQWRFVGSRAIARNDRSIVLASSHLATVDDVPLLVDRHVYMEAGRPYFILTIKITNIGAIPANFYYVYGDEPWVGNYGTAKGNVGWTRDGIINHETTIDSKRLSYAGMFDYGNDVIGEGHNFTGIANFIQWFGDDRPEVYFANDCNGVSDRRKRVPLSSETRFIGLQWGPRQLLPGKASTYVLAVGMAGHDPATGLPTVPNIQIDPELLKRLATSPQFNPAVISPPAG